MSPNPKSKHHYVPVMYTKAWVDPMLPQRVLWRYRPNQHPRRKGPEGVGYEHLFYDAPELPHDENNIEDELMEMENIAAPHLHKLRRGDINLSDQEKSELATFLVLLMTRTPFYRELTNAFVTGTRVFGIVKMLETPGEVEDLAARHKEITGEDLEIDTIRGALQAVKEGRVRIEQGSKAYSLKQMFMGTVDYDEIFGSMQWHLLEAPEGVQFITSEQPVHAFDPVAHALGPKRYRPTSAMEMWFPVSPKYMLTSDYRDGAPSHLVVSADIVGTCNRNQMQRAPKDIYAAYRSDELQREFDRIAAERGSLIPELPPEMID